MKVLCVFGKHQYGDPERGMGTEYAAFVPALARLGHEVIHFDSWEKHKFADYAELNQALLDVVDRTRPNVMLTVQRNYELWLETLQLIQARGDVATISWTTDDSWKYQEVSRFIGTAYHAITTTYAHCVVQYHQDGIPNVLLTQWAANSEQLNPPLPASACQYSVSFVGAAHGDRPKKIAALQDRGIEVTCFGHGWTSGSVPAEEIPKIIRSSVISLNFANACKGIPQVKARTFEVPGAGGFLLTEYAPGLERAYVLGREIVAFEEIDDLAQKIQYFLNHPEERDAIAQAGFLRTTEEHTYDLRLQEILTFALDSHQRWKAIHSQTTPISFTQALKQHQLNLGLTSLRTLLVLVCTLIWGQEKSLKGSRRLMFELSWRILRYQTFTAAGWVGRMFPYC